MTYKNAYMEKEFSELVGTSINFAQMNAKKFLFLSGAELWGFALEDGMCQWDRIVKFTGVANIFDKQITTIETTAQNETGKGEHASYRIFTVKITVEDGSEAVMTVRVNYHEECEHPTELHFKPCVTIPAKLEAVLGDTEFPYDEEAS